MAGNGKRRPPRPQLVVKQSAASPDEAAAIAAAVERFLIETAPVPTPHEPVSRWQRQALRDGVERTPGSAGWGPARGFLG